MNIINLLKIALNAIRTNKFRAFLTMLGIIIGVASVITMLAIGQGSKASIQEQISNMGSNMLFVHPGTDMFRGANQGNTSSQNLTMEDFKTIRNKSEYILYLSPEVGANGQVIYGTNNWPGNMEGVNDEYLNIRKYVIKDGTMFTDHDIQTSAKVCVIGQTVIDNLFTNGEDPIGKTIRFNKIPFKVIGTFEEKGENSMGRDQDDIIVAPYTTVQKRIKAITYLNAIYASAKSEELSAKAKAEITSIMRESHKLKESEEDDFNVRSQEEMATMFSSITNILTILLSIIASISLLVGGIGIMNIMYVSVTERTREIGLRMAVGGKNRDILWQFLIESVFISVTGGVIGILLGVSASFIVKNLLNWPIEISIFSVALSFAVCSFIGIFFGWYPARKASNLDPIDALRYE